MAEPLICTLPYFVYLPFKFDIAVFNDNIPLGMDIKIVCNCNNKVLKVHVVQKLLDSLERLFLKFVLR